MGLSVVDPGVGPGVGFFVGVGVESMGRGVGSG